MKIFHLFKPDVESPETIDHFISYELALDYARTFFPKHYVLPEDKLPTDKQGYNIYFNPVLIISEVSVKTEKPSAYINILARFNIEKKDFVIQREILSEEMFKKYQYGDQFSFSYFSVYLKIDSLDGLEQIETDLLTEYKKNFNHPLNVYYDTNKGYISCEELHSDKFIFCYEEGYLYEDNEQKCYFSKELLETSDVLLNVKENKYIGFYKNISSQEIIFEKGSFICEIDGGNIIPLEQYYS